MAIISLHSAASALSALNTSLDVTANNLANVNTPGFKPSRANFQDLLYVERAQPGIENANGDKSPIGLYVGLGVQVAGTQTQFSQGTPINTGGAFDMMLEGEHSFFRVASPTSPTGFAYTRAGQFTQNNDGKLVLASDIALALEPESIVPPEALNVSIDPTGVVTYATAESAELQEAGRIRLSVFINPAGLKPTGRNLFEVTDASGPAIEGDPGTENFGNILHRFIEGSAVDPTKELIDLIRTQRAFEMNSNTIRTADETLRTVSQLKR